MRDCYIMAGLLCAFLKCFVLAGESRHSHCFKVRFESSLPGLESGYRQVLVKVWALC